MRERTLIIGLICSLLWSPGYGLDAPSATTGSASEPRPEMTFRVEAREVRVGFHVASRNGQPVLGVQKDQLTVYQDGRPIHSITSFSSDDNLPLQLVLMIDSSSSMSKGFDSVRGAAGGFVKRVVRPEVDRNTVVAFSNRAATIASSDVSSPEAVERIKSLQSAGLTALFDSICEVAEKPAQHEGYPTRRILVLLSDGDDNYSRHSLGEAITAAQSADLVVYAVTSSNPKNGGVGNLNLDKITTATGGRVFFLKKYEQSQKVFAEIEQEIRSQYTVTFRPMGNTCGFHRVAIEPADQSLKMRLRNGFYGDCS